MSSALPYILAIEPLEKDKAWDALRDKYDVEIVSAGCIFLPLSHHPERQIACGGVWCPGRDGLGVRLAGRRAHSAGRWRLGGMLTLRSLTNATPLRHKRRGVCNYMQ